jgi:hypothetical protein
MIKEHSLLCHYVKDKHNYYDKKNKRKQISNILLNFQKNPIFDNPKFMFDDSDDTEYHFKEPDI